MITEYDIERFTEGDCWILAKRLHRVTGWALCAFDSGDGIPDWHGFVVMPDGRALDVEGPQEITEFFKKWGTKFHDQINEFKIRDFHVPPIFGHGSYARARAVADELLASL